MSKGKKEKTTVKVSDKKVEREKAFVMAKNIRHDGTLYKEGTQAPEGELRGLFEKKGFIKVI